MFAPAAPVAKGFFAKIGAKIASFFAKTWVKWTIGTVTVAVGVKGFRQQQQMIAEGQAIMANKTAAGGKLPIIYGTRRVGCQVVYMDVSANDSRHVFLVYALSVGECEEVLGRTIELDGNPLTDTARFKFLKLLSSAFFFKSFENFLKFLPKTYILIFLKYFFDNDILSSFFGIPPINQ